MVEEEAVVVRLYPGLFALIESLINLKPKIKKTIGKAIGINPNNNSAITLITSKATLKKLKAKPNMPERALIIAIKMIIPMIESKTVFFLFLPINKKPPSNYYNIFYTAINNNRIIMC